MCNHRGIGYFVYPRKDAKNTLYYKFIHSGKPYHKSAKTTGRKEAILVAQKAIDQVLDLVPSQTLQEARQSIILTEVVSGYLEGRKTLLAPSTYRTISVFFRYLDEAFGPLPMGAITTPMVHSYLTTLHHTLKPANSYWRDILTRYNQFWNWCILTGKCSQNPTKGFPRPKTASLNVYDKVVEDSEFAVLCAHLTPEDEFAVRCFRYMGIYPMDYALSEKQNFYMKDGVLTFERKRGKNHHKFHQPLDGRIEEAIKQKWLLKRSPTERMFWNGSTKEYRAWYVCLSRRVARTWLLCGLGEPKKLGALRHTFCTECVERGVPEDVVLDWAGYSKGSTMLRRVYLHRKSTARYRYVEGVPA